MEYVQKCLNYANKLCLRNLPVIYDDIHFSMIVGIDLEYLLAVANSQNSFYRYFIIPKKNGKGRKIAEPLPVLKDVQHYILRNILLMIPCSAYSKAYKPGATLKNNAKFHRNQQTIIKLDIKDYFPSLHESSVYKLFYNTMGYSKSLSVLLSKLCTLNGGLPQGAPTSPYLSNLLTQKLDEDIYDYCKNNGNLHYTRYADDITISGSMNPANVIHCIKKIINNNNLQINKNKTVVTHQHDRQMVTGVVVNKKLQVPKKYRRSIRLEMHYIMKYGLDSHLSNSLILNKSCNDKLTYCQSLIGKINYCLQINNNDSEMQGYKIYMLTLFNDLKHK